MKVSKKKRSKHWRWVRLCTFLTVLAFVGLFSQVWRVYAFETRQAVAAGLRTHSVPSSAVSGTSGTPSKAAALPKDEHPLPVGAGKPDRWSDGEVVSALSSFYQSIITFMGLLLGLVGVLAVVTLRFLSKAAAEDIAHESAKAAMLHYFETRKFAEDVSTAVEEAGLAKQLEELERQLAIVKRLLKERQALGVDDEDADGDVDPNLAGGEG